MLEIPQCEFLRSVQEGDLHLQEVSHKTSMKVSFQQSLVTVLVCINVRHNVVWVEPTTKSIPLQLPKLHEISTWKACMADMPSCTCMYVFTDQTTKTWCGDVHTCNTIVQS